MAFKFEDLRVWNLAIDLSTEISILIKKFPSEEKFVLATQIQRAADSVALNIAEGSTGQSNPEFKKFLGYASRSGIEVVSCLYLGKKRKIITEDDFLRLYKSYEELTIKIQALKNSILTEIIYQSAVDCRQWTDDDNNSKCI
ncbi:four helix bundle protein [Algoriphagus iocasae]|uniref:Four helix bundle protein n=1 Tax=Algoriphagus iocasae TaxID=1836499 RepID=A0A841MWT3_9BACT|nr:four helix bundle protein [Algoriphagus iocasae]MBB6327068.1 four helix bundle protein [Algoriphagus iocasae]